MNKPLPPGAMLVTVVMLIIMAEVGAALAVFLMRAV